MELLVAGTVTGIFLAWAGSILIAALVNFEPKAKPANLEMERYNRRNSL